MINRRQFLGAGAVLAAGAILPTAAYADDEVKLMGGGQVLDKGEVADAEYDMDYCFDEGRNVSEEIVSEGAVLLKNEGGILPLAEGTGITILGSMSYNYVLGGTGSAGGLDDENTVMINDAFEAAGLKVNPTAWDWLNTKCGGARGTDSADPSGLPSEGANPAGVVTSTWTNYQAIHEFPVGTYGEAKDSIVADGYTDYAVVTFARSGAEGASPAMDLDGDGSMLTGSTYFEINDCEKDLLAFCKENFTHTIVIVNSAAPMELGFLDSDEYNVDAAFWMGHPGEAGINGLAKLVSGVVNPSGRLVDTYAYDVTTNPTYYNTDDNSYTNSTFTTGQVGMPGASQNQTFYQYEEGIYVGYRYFETADAEGYFDSSDFSSIAFKNGAVKGYDQVVQFPFGFGLSYTDFTEEIASSDVQLKAHGTNTVTVKVTNTGSVAGKRAVELYMEAPWQSDTANFGIKGVGLEKSKVVLVAFGKTSELAAGASEEVKLTFQTDDLASFDNFGQGCYVLEAGTYKFNVQEDAHHWGAAGSANAATATVEAKLDASIVYDESGSVSGATYAGARDSDAVVAKNSMDDVTAGDGNMLEGYLSRADFAGGMKSIMAHTSNETPNEKLSDGLVAALNCAGTDSVDYTFQTYLKGEKTSVTETIYAKGANMMPFAQKTPDGQDVSGLDFPEWDKTYYVVDGETDGDLPIKVTEDDPGDKGHVLSVDDMALVPIDTEAGLAVWDKLANMTSLTEAIEIQGNSGWKVPAIDSVGKPFQVCQDGPGEPANGALPRATWFPCAVTIAATWNADLAKDEGVAYGHQAILAGVGGAYAPAMNIHRSPFGGRNFEYYSEDGFISGVIGGNATAGILSTGTNVFPKHCVLNDGDTNRGGNTTWANEQAIREIYMRPFEITIKEHGANGIMGSLNRIGMSWFHYGLYVTMMRKEWDWHGLLITDGDGNDGDVYNSPQAMMCIEGAILNNGGYINNTATESAFGDATQYAYAQQCLHDIIRDALWQYAASKGTDASGNAIVASAATSSSSSSSSSLPTGAIVGGGVAAAAVIAAGVYVAMKKRKKSDAPEAADKAASDEVEDDED